MVTLIVQGGEIELHESEKFNKIRHRLNRAKKLLLDYENGNIDGTSKDERFEPFHMLTFRTSDDGRVTVDPMKVIGATADDPKDSADEDEE